MRSGLPSLLIYLGIGLALGNAGAGIQFDDASITRVLGYAALVLILAEGGLTTSWVNIKDSVAPAAVLSTVGVVVSVLVVAVAAHTLLPLSWTISLLMGAIVTSTDAAAVFSVLRNVPLPRRLSGMLEAESGFNDAPVVILVVAFAAQGVPGGTADPWWRARPARGRRARRRRGRRRRGRLAGRPAAAPRRRRRPPRSSPSASSRSPCSRMPRAPPCTSPASSRRYLAALVLGNMRLPNRPAFQSFATALGWIAQIGLFVLLGLLADPTRLDEQLVPAIVIGLVLLLVARPLSVVASVSWFRMPWRDQAFLSWAGLRGAVPVVLATVPLVVGHARHRVDLRPRLRARRRLHHRAGADPAVGGAAARAHRAGALRREIPRAGAARRSGGAG